MFVEIHVYSHMLVHLCTTFMWLAWFVSLDFYIPHTHKSLKEQFQVLRETREDVTWLRCCCIWHVAFGDCAPFETYVFPSFAPMCDQGNGWCRADPGGAQSSVIISLQYGCYSARSGPPKVKLICVAKDTSSWANPISLRATVGSGKSGFLSFADGSWRQLSKFDKEHHVL